MVPPADRCVIIFDDACGFCRRQLAWVRARDREGRFELLGRSTPELTRRFPQLARDDLSSGLRVVLADGQVRVGPDAVYEIARRLRGWRWLAGLYRVPLLHGAARRIYAAVAARRYAMGGACPVPPASGEKGPSRPGGASAADAGLPQA